MGVFEDIVKRRSDGGDPDIDAFVCKRLEGYARKAADGDVQAAGLLRTALCSDDDFVDLVKAAGSRRHALRHADGSGKFAPRVAASAKLLPWKHGGASLIASAYDAERMGPQNFHPASTGIEP